MSKRALARVAAALLLLCAAPGAARAQKAVFVIRHGEKISEQDQRLTEAGNARARRLAVMLKDAGISAIYSTDTERTRGTVRPLAEALGLKIAIYDTRTDMKTDLLDSRPFVAELARAHPRDVVLVAGHSNTVPDLLKSLGCAETVAIGGDEYDNLFVVIPKADGAATLLRLRY